MPGLNHKGPNNEGPRTGRALGDCGTPNSQGAETNNINAQPGRGLARGRGKASGRGRGLARGNRIGRGRNQN